MFPLKNSFGLNKQETEQQQQQQQKQQQEQQQQQQISVVKFYRIFMTPTPKKKL